jgi:hypothetical protein
VSWIGREAVTGPDIPLDPHLTARQLANLNVHMGAFGPKRRPWIQVGNPMLLFHRVVSLATIDPVAIDTNAHAA